MMSLSCKLLIFSLDLKLSSIFKIFYIFLEVWRWSHGTKNLVCWQLHAASVMDLGGLWASPLNICRLWLLQVVRYHSLVIDAESLPKELIPIAWTSSTDTLSFLETSKSDVIPGAYERKISQNIAIESFSTKSKNGSSWPSAHSEGMQRRNVLMGIMHSTRPHYGVQVCCMSIVFVTTSSFLSFAL